MGAIVLMEGAKETVAMVLERTRRSGEPTVTSPQFRIINAAKTAEIAGFSWNAATYDAATREISALFDSTLAVLLAPATYFMQFRLTIGTDRKMGEREIILQETGP